MTASTVPLTITDNLIDGTPTPGATPVNANSAIRITKEEGNVANVTIADNYLIGAGFTLEVVQQGSPNYTSQLALCQSPTTIQDLAYLDGIIQIRPTMRP